MTGLSVIEINLHITGVHFDKNKADNTNQEAEFLNKKIRKGEINP